MTTSVEYIKQSKSRDPSGERTLQILKLLEQRSHSADEIQTKFKNIDTKFAPSTFKRDLTGLFDRNLIAKNGSYKWEITDHGKRYIKTRENNNAIS